MDDGLVGLEGVGVVGADLGKPPDTELYAVLYDINDSDAINFSDFFPFREAFGREVGGTEPPFAWWADFTKNGVVNFSDFFFLTENFDKAKADTPEILFPANFPDAWRPGTA